MNKLTYVSFGIFFLSSFLASAVHGVFKVLPELMSGFLLVLVLLKAAIDKQLYISPKYSLLLLIVALHVLAGLLVNTVPPGVILTGIRPYIKWIPVFLLPVAYCFHEREIVGLSKFVLMFALIQFPVTLLQRFVIYKGGGSGDVITGLLGPNASGELTVFLVCTISMVFSFYSRNRLSMALFLLLMLILFIPTTINETKITIVILPLVIFIAIFCSSGGKVKFSQILWGGALIGSFVVSFVAIYDYVSGIAGGHAEISEYMGKDGRAMKYLYKDKEWDRDDLLDENRIGHGLSIRKEIIPIEEGGGRIDKILLPLKTLSDDPVSLWFGLGVGNVTTSTIVDFSGEYSHRIGEISGDTLISFLLWEMGVGGVLGFVMFFLFLLYDARTLINEKELVGTVAAGWLPVLVVMFFLQVYFNWLYLNVLVYLFAFFSGYIVSEKERLVRNM